MSETWAARWSGAWAAGAQRFNANHAPAGSATGGQFAASSSSSSKSGKGTQAAHPNGAVKPASRKTQLLAQAKTAREKIAELKAALAEAEKKTAGLKGADAKTRKLHREHLEHLKHEIHELRGQADGLEAEAGKL